MVYKGLFISLLLTTALTYSLTAVAAINTDPDSSAYFLEKGLLEKQNGRRLESLKNFEKAANYNAASKAITTELASAYLDLHRYTKAREMFKKLVQLGEGSAPNYRQLMILSHQLKQFKEVLVYADMLTKETPGEKLSYYVGRANYDLGNYEQAIKHLNQAAKEEPENALVHYTLAHTYSDVMNYKLSLASYKKAIELDPKQNIWIYEMGLVSYVMNDGENALKYILEAGQKGFRRYSYYLENLGLAYITVGQFDQAVSTLTELLKDKPGNIDAMDLLAEAYNSKGDYDQAIEYWEKMQEKDNSNASSMYMLGMAYQKKGGRENIEKGKTLCKLAIDADPSLAKKQRRRMR